MQDCFVKRGTPDTASLLGEAAGLRWLSEAMPAGGMPVVEVVSASPRKLVERRLAPGKPSIDSAERAGVALARTHAMGAPWWGAPPPGWCGPYLIGHSATPTVPKRDAPTSWGSFFAQWRLLPYLEQAVRNGGITSAEAVVVEHVAARLQAGMYDAAQPGLLASKDVPVARIHGDLWSGNLIWDADPGNAVGATLIDPMAHGGHAETDLAMLALFGCPHLDRIIAAYDEESPLADGWRERVRLHQLAPLLHHCALFGRAYAAETLAVARHYA